MPPEEIQLSDDEDIIRVYTRLEKQTRIFENLISTDFARIMATHSGISLWRSKYITSKAAMAKLDVQKLKGTAICKAGTLRRFGVRFFSNGPEDPHLSARCKACDLSVNYQAGVCQTTDGSDCAFNLHTEDSLTKTFTNSLIFTIERPIVPPH